MNKNTNPITINNTTIIGIDHGYGNIKTAHCCFPTGVTPCDGTPLFSNDILTFEGKSYVIGDSHKEFLADKMQDQDYYLLTLAAIGREMHINKQQTASVLLAVGLPLTWVSRQKEDFKQYLLQNKNVQFTYRGIPYQVEFVGCEVFPQGFSAVADKLRDFTGVNMLCDIGNGTMNVMYINDRKPVSGRCFTEKFGVHQCMLAIRENLMRTYGVTIDETVIEHFLRKGKADLGAKYTDVIRKTASEYVDGIFRKLREHEYDPDLMKLYVMGGGYCMIQQFGQYDPSRVFFNSDVCATAKGYELLAENKLRKAGGIA